MNILRTMGTLWLATLGLLAACDRNDTATSYRSGNPPGVANAQPSSNTNEPTQTADQPAGGMATSVMGQTLDRLANERCTLESSCERVGAGKQYASRDQCLTAMRASIRNDLDSFRCNKGFDANQVETCASAIEHFDCSRSFVTIETVPACRSAELCAK